jgi:uncharacterized protein (DUF4213/DUF364 family)
MSERTDTPPADGGSTHILDETAACLAELHGAAMQKLRVERVIVGVFFTGVQFSNGCAGVAYTPPESVERASTRILHEQPHRYRGMNAEELVCGKHPGAFAPVIRLAALNALSVPFFESGEIPVAEGVDLSEISELFVGRKICMVGAIIPLLKKLGKMGAKEITIIDRKKETQAEAELGRFVPLQETAGALAACETAIFTGATIANGSLEELLRHVRADAAIAVAGPTAGFVPAPLFRRGVVLVGTVAVTDGEQALEIISEGGGAYQLFARCVRKINLINEPRLAEIRQNLLREERG